MFALSGDVSTQGNVPPYETELFTILLSGRGLLFWVWCPPLSSRVKALQHLHRAYRTNAGRAMHTGLLAGYRGYRAVAQATPPVTAISLGPLALRATP
jgi:hypothetical protein